MASEPETSQFEPYVAAQIVSVKLTADNYSLWKSMVVPVLKQFDMLNIVQGLSLPPPLSQKDQNCMNFIKLTLSEAVLSHAVGCSSARALWLKLEEQNEIVQARACVQSVQHMISRLKTMKKARLMSMSDYYQSAKQTSDKLKAAGLEVSDGKFVKYILKGLPSDYASFVNSIGPNADALTPEMLHELLLEEEAGRKRVLYRQVMKYGTIVGASFVLGFTLGLTVRSNDRNYA